jgi:hypothetical protein
MSYCDVLRHLTKYFVSVLCVINTSTAEYISTRVMVNGLGGSTEYFQEHMNYISEIVCLTFDCRYLDKHDIGIYGTQSCVINHYLLRFVVH